MVRRHFFCVWSSSFHPHASVWLVGCLFACLLTLGGLFLFCCLCPPPPKMYTHTHSDSHFTKPRHHHDLIRRCAHGHSAEHARKPYQLERRHQYQWHALCWHFVHR